MGHLTRWTLRSRWYSAIVEQPASNPVNRYKLFPAAATGEALRAKALEVFGLKIDGELRGHPAEEIVGLIDREEDAQAKRTMRHMADRVAFAKEVLGFEPESLQEVALRSWARRMILNCNRQWGKSSVAAIRVLHRAWFWPGSLILLVSRAHAQSGELLQKIRTFLQLLGIQGTVRGDGVNRLSLKLPNGSRIIALPGGQKPARSYSKAAMVVIDEAAIVPDPVHDAVTPTMSRTNGEVLASTPMGKRGAFYRAWTFGGEAWFRVFGPVDVEHPGSISREFLDAERARSGADYFDQEYLCVFLDRDSHMFGDDDMQTVFTQDLESWEPKR